MANPKSLYRLNEWFDFAQRVRARDGNKCLKCHRTPPDVVLQVHHENYVEGRPPWKYPLSDCTTLCKGCHAREHGHIEPDSGWYLLAIDDLGELSGTCEKEGCGTDIRYEHLTYHPKWGYKIVGSTCIEYLTKEDIHLSSEILKNYKAISRFVHGSDWQSGRTQKDKPFIGTKHGHDLIRIYGNKGRYAFQVALKEKGRRKHYFEDVVSLPGKSLEEVKELAFITLKGLTAEKEEEKTLLRNLYKSVK